jgi:hypothetical protein
MSISLSSKSKSSKNNNLLSSNIITTPCEKVLSILNKIKMFLSKFSKDQIKLIQKLDWAIKIITSRSLYSYELKEKEAIYKLSRENPEFKQLVDFVSEYNEKVIKMNRKYNYILTDKLLQKPSIKLNRKKIERRYSFAVDNRNFLNLLKLEEGKNQQNKNFKKGISNKNNNLGKSLGFKSKFINAKTLNANSSKNKEVLLSNRSKNKEKNPFDSNNIKKKVYPKIIKKSLININDEVKKDKNQDDINENLIFFNNNINYTSHKSANIEDSIRKLNLDNKGKNRYSLFPSVQKISITINNNDNNLENDNLKDVNEINRAFTSYNRRKSTINSVNISLTNSIICRNNSKNTTDKNKNITHLQKEYSFLKIQNKINYQGYDASKLITEKNFDVFQLKDLIGYNNVLPFAGRIILENLGLIDEEILNIDKLDQFLVSVSNQYKPDTLYHNCLHGTDVTQSCYIFFSHSNAEKIAKTNVLDLLSVFISSLGHDIGHPGLTNTFHINDSTDMAITYNDISVLENFHASTLFKTIRKTETNIFDKLTTNDYKIIRKRMIAEILATDMANHGKVLSLIKSKISVGENGRDFKLNLLTGNEQTKNEEQQCLLDYIIHLADLAHNTRLFQISLKWVELLSEEFWRQGDLEKEKNLPISFLCDRENTNVPQSQKGFISGFILPTFECLYNIFPTLKFTVENANHNLKEWQKLIDEGRKRGWTPPKIKKGSFELSKSTKKNDYNEHSNLGEVKNHINNNKKINKISKSISINSTKNSNNNNINNDIRQSYKKEFNYVKIFKNNGEPEKIQNNKKKEFNTPVKLRISEKFNLSKDKKYNDYMALSNMSKDKFGTECNFKKNVIKINNKKNVNKKKGC